MDKINRKAFIYEDKIKDCGFIIDKSFIIGGIEIIAKKKNYFYGFKLGTALIEKNIGKEMKKLYKRLKGKK